MTKPFLIINVVDGDVGVIRQRDSWDEAIDTATSMAKEQCSDDEESIREELDEDGNFMPQSGGFKIFIAQAEDD